MFTTEFENLIMDNIFKGNSGALPLPDAYYAGLSTTAPNISGGNITEPVGNGYSRVKITSFSSSTNGKVSNTNVIEFPQSSGSWGTITHCVLFDGESPDAKAVWFNELKAPQVVSVDNVLAFKPNALWFELIDSSEII